MWRHKAYELGGTPLPWKPEELLREEYERGFIDGMQHQMQSSVDKAVNPMAQPEQEPVAWRYRMPVEDGHWVWNYATYIDDPKDQRCEPLYITPPQRKPLTDEEIWKFVDQCKGGRIDFARAIEAAHGIKE